MSDPTRRTLLAALAATMSLSVLTVNAAAPSGPPLWLVRRRATRIYFFGQLPLRTDSFWQSAPVMRAFDASSEYWSENPDPTTAAPPAPRTSSGPQLFSVVTTREMERLRALLVREGLKENALDAAQLSAAYSAVSYLQDHALGVDYQVMPEGVLRERARQAGKSLHSEWASFEELVRFRESMTPDTRQALDLELFRRGLEEAEDVEAARRGLEGWLRGDLAALNAMEQRVRERYPLIATLVGSERNRAWVGRTDAIMERSATTFVCQGIGHLLGPQGIPAMLRQAGYEVERVA